MRRESFVSGAVAAAAFAAAGSSARAQTRPVVRMASVATETFAVALYARDSGAFARAGVDVDIQFFTSGAPANVAMSGGAVDVAADDPLQLTNAINHGLPFQYFAGGLLHVATDPTTALCVAHDSPIKSAKDLEGTTIAVPTVLDLASLGVREWMLKGGADPNKAQFVELSNPAMPAAIIRGTVAAGMLGEPYISSYPTDLRILANAYNAVADRFLLNAYYARRDWLAANPDVARRVAAGLYEGARWANSHHAESLAMLVKYSKADATKLSGMHRAVYATALEPALLRPVIDIGLKYKAIEKAVPLPELIAKLA
jgi:NitT/TauT family transport system substrate-binding protein